MKKKVKRKVVTLTPWQRANLEDLKNLMAAADVLKARGQRSGVVKSERGGTLYFNADDDDEKLVN